MDWKKEAEGKLRDYAARRQSLTTLPQMIEESELRRRSIRAARTDAAAVSGGGSAREDMLLGSMVRQDELEKRLEMTKLWVASMDAALALLTDEERLLLDRFYIHPCRGSVERLCDELCLERPGVYKRKDRALRRFTMALYGWEES